jgi:hypothetical protein
MLRACQSLFHDQGGYYLQHLYCRAETLCRTAVRSLDGANGKMQIVDSGGRLTFNKCKANSLENWALNASDRLMQNRLTIATSRAHRLGDPMSESGHDGYYFPFSCQHA